MQKIILNTDRWKINFSAILDVVAADFLEGPIVGSVRGDELSDDRVALGRVDRESRSATVKVLDSTRVGVDSAAPSIALTSVARMGCVNSRQAVGLPNVLKKRHSVILFRFSYFVVYYHLIAGGTILLGRLSVAIAGSVLGAGVSGRFVTAGIHGDEVEGRVHSAAHVGHVHLEREFPVHQVEDAVPVWLNLRKRSKSIPLGYFN